MKAFVDAQRRATLHLKSGPGLSRHEWIWLLVVLAAMLLYSTGAFPAQLTIPAVAA
jgi:hypothetical protein